MRGGEGWEERRCRRTCSSSVSLLSHCSRVLEKGKSELITSFSPCRECPARLALHEVSRSRAQWGGRVEATFLTSFFFLPAPAPRHAGSRLSAIMVELVLLPVSLILILLFADPSSRGLTNSSHSQLVSSTAVRPSSFLSLETSSSGETWWRRPVAVLLRSSLVSSALIFALI